MINLLPKQQKKELAQEFKFRLTLSALTLSFIIVFMGLLFLTPLFFYARNHEVQLEEELIRTRELTKNEITTEANEIIKNVKIKVKSMGDYEHSFLVTEKVLDKVLSHTLGEVSLRKITYLEKDGKKGVGLEGIAPSREVLKNFVYRLGSDTSLQNVTIPLSNYLKGADLQFTITFYVI